MDQLHSLVKTQPPYATSACTALLNQLKYFAGNQIRNTASVGGNIVTGSPISDTCPLYMACGATFVLQGQGMPERQVLAEDFFLGYRCDSPLRPAPLIFLTVNLPCCRFDLHSHLRCVAWHVSCCEPVPVCCLLCHSSTGSTGLGLQDMAVVVATCMTSVCCSMLSKVALCKQLPAVSWSIESGVLLLLPTQVLAQIHSCSDLHTPTCCLMITC